MRDARTICYHHNDADGFCAGAVVRYCYKKIKEDVICRSISYPYEESEFDDIVPIDTVYFVDFCPSLETLKNISAKAGCVFVIDHHLKTQEIKENFFAINTIIYYSDTLSGCQLTWDVMVQQFSSFGIFERGAQRPSIVNLVGEYDCWNHKNIHCVWLAEALWLKDVIPSSNKGFKNWEFWFETFGHYNKSPIMELIKEGKTISRYKKGSSKAFMKLAFEVGEKNKFIIVNTNVYNSYSFDSVVKKDTKALLWYYFDPESGLYRWSIRSSRHHEDFNVREVAQIFGGDGHSGASGFYTHTPKEFFRNEDVLKILY